MHARFHPEYKTDRELDDAIARLEQLAQNQLMAGLDAGCYLGVREGLLYDLANRRDDGEIIHLGTFDAVNEQCYNA